VIQLSSILSEFPTRVKHSIAASDAYASALKRMKSGTKPTSRSWVYEKIKDPDLILTKWQSTLSSLSSDGDLKSLSAWDLSKSDKYGPQGGTAPFDERHETLLEYWSHLREPEVFSTREWKIAISNTVKRFKFNGSGAPLPAREVIARGMFEDKYNTSSGDPLFLKRKSSEAQEQALSAEADGTWKNFYPVLGSRATMGKTGDKARWIFMFPFAVNLHEQRFQMPLQDYLRKISDHFFLPWEGIEYVQRHVSAQSSELLKFGADYSKMDQHFNYYHALQVYEVIKMFFQPQYRDQLLESLHYTFHCDVVSCEGMLKGPHAMPSGSGWTNFLETVFNVLLIEYLHVVASNVHIVTAMGIGDDQLWFIDYANKNFDPLTEFIVSIFEKCGLEANAEKQEVGYETTVFLQRRFSTTWNVGHVKCAGVYPTIRALTSEIFPERWHQKKDGWDSKLFALRCLMILENTMYHPLFAKFCKFIADGNDNIWEFVTAKPAVHAAAVKQAKSISGFLPTYNQANLKTKVLDLASYRVLSGMRKN